MFVYGTGVNSRNWSWNIALVADMRDVFNG